MYTVLVVEDDQDSADMYTFLLLSQGYKVLQAHSVKEGLAMCAEHGDIDLLLTDLHLGDGLGSDMVKALGEYVPRSTVLVTGYDKMPSKRYPGFDDYLVKPVDANLLFRTIRACIQLKEEEVA